MGVSRNAGKREITKAYRKLALEWHPDKFESEEDKKIANAKFMDIADAKEVLSDPNKRQMFDDGEVFVHALDSSANIDPGPSGR